MHPWHQTARLLVASLALWIWSSSLAGGMPAGKYLEDPGAKVAVILAQGQGLVPDSQVVSPLRRAMHRELGFHTLSLQTPVLPGAPSRSQERFLAYAATFPAGFGHACRNRGQGPRMSDSTTQPR